RASAAPSPRWLARLATDIGISTAPARILGVRRAHVEDRRDHGEERLADARQLLQRETALVELPLLDALLEDAPDQSANAAGRRLGERARRAFDAVREHQDGRLLGTRARARVAELLGAHRRVGL